MKITCKSRVGIVAGQPKVVGYLKSILKNVDKRNDKNGLVGATHRGNLVLFQRSNHAVCDATVAGWYGCVDKLVGNGLRTAG